MNAYDVGDQVRVTATFKDLDGDAVDPTTVTVKYQKPGGSVVTVASESVTNSATGVYFTDLTIDNSPGVWRYRFEGTGALVAAEGGTFYVTASDLA